MKKALTLLWAALPLFCILLMVARANERSHQINLPTSKTLTVPVPGFIARTNSYPATIAVSPMDVTPRCSTRDMARKKPSAAVHRDSRPQQQSVARVSR